MNPTKPDIADDHQPLLVLDLDETLIHSSSTQYENVGETFRVFNFHVHLRPGLEHFLQTVFAHFKVAVWTSADYEYARQIVKQVFPPEHSLEYLWAREDCAWRYVPELDKYEYLKDFKELKERGWNLDRTIAVDDSPEKHVDQSDNLILIPAWVGETDDDDLPLLADYLVDEILPRIKAGQSITSFEKQHWKSSIKKDH